MLTNTRLQSYMAIASFSVGTLISCVCLFIIDPKGEIDTTAISIVSEFLVLAGGLLGIKASFDTKMHRFEAQLKNKIDKYEERHQELAQDIDDNGDNDIDGV